MFPEDSILPSLIFRCMHAKLLQSCSTVCNPMDCSMLCSSVHEVLQRKILEWVVISISRGSSWPRDWTCISSVSCIGRQVLYHQHHLDKMNQFFLPLIVFKHHNFSFPISDVYISFESVVLTFLNDLFVLVQLFQIKGNICKLYKLQNASYYRSRKGT